MGSCRKRSRATPSGLFLGLLTVDVAYLLPAMPPEDEKVVARDHLISAGSCLAAARGESFPAALRCAAECAAESCSYFGVDRWIESRRPVS